MEERRLKPVLYKFGKISFSHVAEPPERDPHGPQSGKEPAALIVFPTHH